MTTYTDIYKLKSEWQHLNRQPLLSDISSFASEIRSSVSSKKRVLRRMRFMLALCVVGAIIAPWMFYVLGCSLIIAAGVGLYFVVMAALTILTMCAARCVQLDRLSVIQSARSVLRVQQMRLRHQRVGAALALPVMAALCYELYGSCWALVGLLVGTVLGLVISFRVNHYTSEWIKQIIADLE